VRPGTLKVELLVVEVVAAVPVVIVCVITLSPAFNPEIISVLVLLLNPTVTIFC
jgi:hypothetical protein